MNNPVDGGGEAAQGQDALATAGRDRSVRVCMYVCVRARARV